MCNALGLDSISAGVTLAWYLEVWEKEPERLAPYNAEKTGWNEGPAYLDLLNKISRREGIGELLAEGTRKAAEKIGGRTIDYAMQVKGQEISSP